jgi:hypothetical protein
MKDEIFGPVVHINSQYHSSVATLALTLPSI